MLFSLKKNESTPYELHYAVRKVEVKFTSSLKYYIENKINRNSA